MFETENGIKLIDDNNSSDVQLLTFAQIKTFMGDELFYVEKGLDRYYSYTGKTCSAITKLNNTKILPIKSDLTREDGDGDGLNDVDVYIYEGKVIAPQDKNPLQIDGPAGMWKTHIENVTKNDIPSELGDWYGEKQYVDDSDNMVVSKFKLDLYAKSEFIKVTSTMLTYIWSDTPEEIAYMLKVLDWRNYINLFSTNSGIEGFMAFMEEFEYLNDTGKLDISAFDYFKIIKLAKSAATNALSGDTQAYIDISTMMNILRDSMDNPNSEENNKILASLGSRALNFKTDTSGKYVHSQRRTWQAIGGYNNLYDNVFGTATNRNMRREKFSFTVDDMEYILWAWRGDYLNLGAGTEVGIYSRPTWLTKDPELDQYFTDYDLAMPMTLYLYNYENEDEITNLVSWEPTEKQWWITGFNPYYSSMDNNTENDIDVKKQIMICSVDFSQFTDENGDNEMYTNLKNSIIIADDYKKQYFTFDNVNSTVWIMWYEVI